MKPTIFRDISNEDGWIGFLEYLADYEYWDAKQIINVVRKPWHWEKTFDEFVRATNAPDQPDFETLSAVVNGWPTPAEEEAFWAAEEAALEAALKKEASDGRTP
tara:strand:+ start:172 stop:483 length:312 start_codon:yes stop_codon:yes gene_type:complete